MAKPRTGGGLGRGLDALLGDSYAPQGVPSQRRERQQPIEEKKPEKAERMHVSVEPGEIPAYDPILEPTSERDIENAPVIEREVVAVIEDSEQQIHEEALVEESKGERLVTLEEVPIDLVKPNPDQPRTNFDKEELQELADSIKADGLLQPILVSKLDDGTYRIIAGERRWQACVKAGLNTIPVCLKEVDDDRALELALIENIQRSDLNPIEEAYGYKRLMERKNLTQAEVAQLMSKGRSTVANALRLLDLPEEAQQLLFEEKITAGHARAILSIPDVEGRKKLTQKLMDEKLSVRETEAIARLMAGKASHTSETTRTPLPPLYKKVAKALRDTLDTNVRVKTTKGKNKIEIEFKDEEDLTRLFQELIDR